MSRPKILAVDDTPQNLRLLEAYLPEAEYELITAASGEEALRAIAEQRPDLLLLDILMPGMDGYELTRRVRADPATAHLPIVLMTASVEQDKTRALESGADDFIPKPVQQHELHVRVRSLVRIKRYHDDLRDAVETVERQRQELSRFLSPQVSELIASDEGAKLLEGHRRQITVVFCDLRGFTAFAETAEPEEVLGVLREYHREMGVLIVSHRGTLEHFAGDGFMVFFNDPVQVEHHELEAVRMAVAMRDRFNAMAAGWRKRGYDLNFGVGIAVGYATLGRIGFEGRYDYGAVGNVVIMGARLAAEAKGGQILLSQRLHAAVEGDVEAESAGELSLKGISRPVPAINVIGLRKVTV
jgi:class 3 adenylate cyclase